MLISKQKEILLWQKEKRPSISGNVLPADAASKFVPKMRSQFPEESTPKLTKTCAWDAENVQKNVPQALSHWRRPDNERKKEMVRLPVDLFPYLFDFRLFQYPFCVAWASLLLYSPSHRPPKRK